jgi:hypothetical protein
MTSTDVWALRERSRAPRIVAPPASDGSTTLAPQQTRTCARCGRYTTFVLEDPAGSWYACFEYGRLA